MTREEAISKLNELIECTVDRGMIDDEYEVYVRVSGDIKVFREEDMERYMVRHKVLDEQEMEWQRNAVEGM